MNIILMIVVAVLVFGAVIFFHELGHFCVAKWSGIKVNEFAIGMGPTLLKFGKKETKYALRLLPIGGFVSMEGEDEESEDSRSFTRAPIWRRVLVIIAGACMNLILGFLALVLLVAANGQELVGTNSIVNVTSDVGLQDLDTILKINGHRAFTYSDLDYEFARTQNGTFNLLIERDGEKIELENVTFETRTVTDPETGELYMNDATGEPMEVLDLGFNILGVPKNPWNVIKEAFNTTLSYSRLIYQTLGDLLTGRAPINNLSGPVGIVSEIGKAVSIGWRPVVQLLALISINLGVVNMLPLPALDGGKTVLLIIEGIRRKPMPQKYEAAINVAGFALLMALMLFVTFIDIQRLVT